MNIIGVILAVAGLSMTSVAAEAPLPASAVIWDVSTGQQVEPTQLIEAIAPYDQLILGETHSSEEVQLAEAWLLSHYAKTGPTTFAWEFLNWSERETALLAYHDWSEQRISDDQLLTLLLGSAKGQETYLHPLRVARDLGLPLLATNLTRAEKRPVVQSGIHAADPSLIPTGFEMGGDAYWKRFLEAMGGHGDPEALENYFAAQCLTDDVIADHLTRHVATPRTVLVVGNFHTAYFDGTWRRLEKREPKTSRVLVHLEKTEAPLSLEQQKALLTDEKYGPLAHYVIFF